MFVLMKIKSLLPLIVALAVSTVVVFAVIDADKEQELHKITNPVKVEIHPKYGTVHVYGENDEVPIFK